MQRRRLADAIEVLESLDSGFSGSILDFGAGNGELSRLIARRFPKARVVCYEPALKLLQEAKLNLDETNNVVLAQDLEEIKGMRFEYVFCLEVFEHLPPRQAKQAVRRLRRLLVQRGTLVVGVPNELFLPALVKGLFRMKRRYRAYDARLTNILKAALG